MTARGGAYREDEYTLNVGCLPTLVDFKNSSVFDNQIDLFVGAPLINIYQIQIFEAYSNTTMPTGLHCPIE